MTRRVLIARIRRQIYGGQPTEDASITVNLVNVWLNDAIAFAARKNYTDSIALDGIAYVNNSFYTTFKGLALSKDEDFLWKITLPQIPLGIGQNEGISLLRFKDSTTQQLSYPVIWLTENQRTYVDGMRPIPNRILAYQESKYVYVITSLLMDNFTATVTMISGGDSTDLDSIVNVPDDYIPTLTEYIKQQLVFERMQPVDLTNDGSDAVKTT